MFASWVSVRKIVPVNPDGIKCDRVIQDHGKKRLLNFIPMIKLRSFDIFRARITI